MSEIPPADDGNLKNILHDLRQPLNVIRLTNGNIRSRIIGLLDAASATYLAAKLDRIEEQTQRAAELIDQLLGTGDNDIRTERKDG